MHIYAINSQIIIVCGCLSYRTIGSNAIIGDRSCEPRLRNCRQDGHFFEKHIFFRKMVPFYSENNICVLNLLRSFSRLLLFSIVIYTMSKLGGGGAS